MFDLNGLLFIFNHMVKYNERQLDSLFGALSDTTRRKIIEKLTKNDLIVTEIASDFDISLPAISKHIKVLENAGLVKRKRDGKLHKISYNKEAVKTAWSWINQYREFWDKSFDSLAELLDKKAAKEKKNV